MFFYMVMCGLALCASAYQLTVSTYLPTFYQNRIYLSGSLYIGIGEIYFLECLHHLGRKMELGYNRQKYGLDRSPRAANYDLQFILFFS